MNKYDELPLPDHFDPNKLQEVWKVDYRATAAAAEKWRQRYTIHSSHEDDKRICLILVDVQNTFCLPGFELFVAGRSGNAAVEDNRRLCSFIYRNLNRITHIIPTMDTHQAIQIFHSIFFIDDNGDHPSPMTFITAEDIDSGRWRLNPKVAPTLGYSEEFLSSYIRHYTNELSRESKYELMIWPYHAMTGGIGHALVSSVEEALFFYTVCRYSQPEFQLKGDHPITEHYSALRPEVIRDHRSDMLQTRNEGLFRNTLPSRSIYNRLKEYDMTIIAGQAKSHCVAWTVEDIINYIDEGDRSLLRNLYILEDCTSPVVVEGTADFTDHSEEIFRRFANNGVRIVRSTDPIENW